MDVGSLTIADRLARIAARVRWKIASIMKRARGTAKTDIGPATIGGRLARIAARVPDKIAIIERNTRLSYWQLDVGASAIARSIVVAGQARPGTVCLFFERKAAALQAIFGAGRSGRTYVPLDARDPDERLRYILQACEPIVLLTDGTLLAHAHALAPAGCVVVDVDHLPAGGEAAPLPDVSADSLAYVLYTSGSTGHPKGVEQTHRNLLFFADAYAKTLKLGEADRVSLLFSLSFSAANMDIFGGLLNGATLCAYDLRRDGVAQLADWLDHRRITVLHAVPTAFRELMRSLAPDRQLTHLRAVDLGGESVFGSDVELVRRHAPKNCVLVNHLAATEASVIAQFIVDHRHTFDPGGILPVGSSPDGLRVLIRRDDGSDADIDEVGEIVVMSPHVSPGYRAQPELNAAAFAADPVMAGWRRYFTGDLGRFDHKRNLHFLGRKGGRVKIRGHSVDLTEVEAALATCPGIEKAAVEARSGDSPTVSERLVAYLVAGESAERDPQIVRRRLAARIPSYMLPTEILFVDALPLTASGKVDRRALAATPPALTSRTRAIEPPRDDPERALEPPRDDLERAIAGIFQQLLEVAPIGRYDDFFLIGGDSLSAVELQIRLRDTFGTSPSNLVEEATVGAIAAGIRRNRASPATGAQRMPVLVPIREQGSAPPLFLIHGRLGQAIVSPYLLRLLGDDQPVWSIQARGLDGIQEPHSTIEAMAADYLAEIRRQRPEGPYFIGALCIGAFIAMVLARSLRQAGQSVLPLLLFDPPNILRPQLAEGFTDERILARLKQRQDQGRIDVPIGDPQFVSATKRTALAFGRAIGTHTPRVYDGPVFVLSSRARAAASDAWQLNDLFPGLVERCMVAATHEDIMDVRNSTFAKSLTRCMGMIREAAKVA
jgi:amino acid adenylation domain-containing protein